MKLLLLLIGTYLLYRFITGFVIPVASVTRQMNSKIKTFQRQQEEMFRQQQTTSSNTTQQAHKASAEDYLDFEEIK